MEGNKERAQGRAERPSQFNLYGLWLAVKGDGKTGNLGNAPGATPGQRMTFHEGFVAA